MNINSALLCAVTAIALTGGRVAAQDTPRPELPPEEWQPFTTLDVNGDGRLTRDEARAQPELARYFDDVDQNRDGLITDVEYRAFQIAPWQTTREAASITAPVGARTTPDAAPRGKA